MREKLERLASKYHKDLFRAAFGITHHISDAEDAVQNTYIKYLEDQTDFENERHLKAWLLRTVMNQAKDTMKTFWHRNRVSLEDYMQYFEFSNKVECNLAEAVLTLPSRYRIVISLYYYEDFSVAEIANALHLSESAVKSRLSRGRRLLKKRLDIRSSFESHKLSEFG
jgi:RNA polymerase sigma factor (sigma-70 family)